MRGARVVLAALTALCLTACTTVVSGSPGIPTRAVDLLGDFATLDPCSLVETSGYTEFGGAGRGRPTGFDTCQIDVGESEGRLDAIVVIGRLAEVLPETDETFELVHNLPGGMWVKEYDSAKDPEYPGGGDDAICQQLLGFTDGVALGIDAFALQRSARSTLCDLADTATREVHKVIRAGGVEHRGYPERSLGRVDACGLVAGDPLAGSALYSMAERRGRPAGHECSWQVDDGKPGAVDRFVQLTLTTGSLAENHASESGEERTVGGRESVVVKTSSDEQSSCEVLTEHTVGGEQEADESARVYAAGPKGKADEVCDGALAVAEAAWPKLPRR